MPFWINWFNGTGSSAASNTAYDVATLQQTSQAQGITGGVALRVLEQQQYYGMLEHANTAQRQQQWYHHPNSAGVQTQSEFFSYNQFEPTPWGQNAMLSLLQDYPHIVDSVLYATAATPVVKKRIIKNIPPDFT
jgi:hypothetical protein